MDINMATPTLTTYITDLTNGCTFLDSLVSDKSTDASRIQEVIAGIEYQMGLSIVADSDEDLSSFKSSVSDAKTYLAGL